MREMYTLPSGNVTQYAGIAACAWAEAFYQAKDALQSIRPVPEMIIRGDSVRNLDEILLSCDKVLDIGE